MDIKSYIDEFAAKNHRHKPYSKIVKTLLVGGKPYSLNMRSHYVESEYLEESIRTSVKGYSSNKDNAIAMYKDLVAFLEKKKVKLPKIEFPPISVSNTFERLMYIAKYIQEDKPISDLPDKLWISDRQVEEDLSRLRGKIDPIQIQGRKFYIPEKDISRENGMFRLTSTLHPIFLAENLTQVLITLKGLKAMSENSLYRPYAEETGREIWNQLSPYARNRIRVVLRDILPDDLKWYESLSGLEGDNYFHTEAAVSQRYCEGASVLLDAMKNGKTFCVEYDNNGMSCFYKDCIFVKHGEWDGPMSIIVDCSEGRIELVVDKVIRSAYTIEELTAN